MIVSGWVFNTRRARLGRAGLEPAGHGRRAWLAAAGLCHRRHGRRRRQAAGRRRRWVGSTVTFYAFCLSAIIGGVIAVAMVLYRRGWTKHENQFLDDPERDRRRSASPTELATIAAERKSSMLLLPYGIPIAIGTIALLFLDGNAGMNASLDCSTTRCLSLRCDPAESTPQIPTAGSPKVEKLCRLCRKNRRGAAVVEFAIVAPVFFLLVFRDDRIRPDGHGPTDPDQCLARRALATPSSSIRTTRPRCKTTVTDYLRALRSTEALQ